MPASSVMPLGVTLRFASPEDTLLHMLIWYRPENEVPEPQRGDILGILKIQGQALDRAYLDAWAPRLDVADPFARARREMAGSD